MAKILYVPMDLGLIKEGQALKEINEELMKIQTELVRFVERWGERVDKAKSELTIKLKFCIATKEPDTCEIQQVITKAMPARPTLLARATPNIGQDDQPYLFVRAMGQGDEPGQRAFEVHHVDPETGEVKE